MSSSPFVTPLSDLAVIEITGADAASFLHGQLSHDISGLAPGQARLAGYCTPKGRLLGSMVVWLASGPEVPVLRALVKADIAESIVKRLSMFVLRAKARLSLTPIPVFGLSLSPAGGDHELARAFGDGAALDTQVATLPHNPLPWSVAHTQAGDWIATPRPANGAVRWWLAAAGHAGLKGLPDTASASWHAADMAAGLPWIQAATQELFIPQTLNLDLIDGVSFTKGCYPGQEVVARSHYRGTVKRRMAYGVVTDAAGIDAASLPGADTFDARHPDNPAGRIVNAVRVDDQDDEQAAKGRIHLLMEVQLSDLPEARFCLAGAGGPAIERHALPYAIEAS